MSKINKKKKSSFRIGYIFRVLITALALINLVLLFVLDYNVPGISTLITKIENHRDYIDGVANIQTSNESNVIFEYKTETFTYDGKSVFDATSDVTVRDEQGNELDKTGLTLVVSGDSEKEINYTYQSADGKYYGTDSRPLTLENYDGPEIEVSGDMPTLTDDNLVDVAALTAGNCKATDGYGNDISANVSIVAVPDDAYNGIFIVKFTVKNVFGDIAQAEAGTSTYFLLPHLKLTTNEVQIKKGSLFDPASYILYAVDANGSDLKDRVLINNGVDIQTPGDYKVKYDLTNDDEQSIKTKVLKVHVVE